MAVLRKISIALVLLFPFFNRAQDSLSVPEFNADSVAWRFNIDVFEFGGGVIFHSQASKLPASGDYMLSKTKTGMFSFSAPTFEFYLKEKYGVQASFQLLSCWFKNEDINQHIPQTTPQYFAQAKNNSGFNSLFLFSAGPTRHLRIKPHAELKLFCNVLGGAGQISGFNFGFKDVGLNNYFTRYYDYKDLRSFGLNAGINLHGVSEPDDKKFTGLYLRLALHFINLSGNCVVTDKDYNAVELSKTSQKFSQNIFAVSLGGSVYFSYFHYKRRP